MLYDAQAVYGAYAPPSTKRPLGLTLLLAIAHR